MTDTVPWSSYEHDIREMRERAVLAEARVADLETALHDAERSLWRLGAGPEALKAKQVLAKGKGAK